jgi:hypothetical protein
MRRALAQRQERRHRAVACEPVATGFSGQQELEQKAKAIAVGRASVQPTKRRLRSGSERTKRALAIFKVICI